MLGHRLDGKLCGEAESENVDVEHPPPILHLAVHQRLGRAQTGVVDAHVHLAKVGVLLDPLEQLPDLDLLSNVTATRVELPLLALQLLGQDVHPLLPASAADHLHYTKTMQ